MSLHILNRSRTRQPMGYCFDEEESIPLVSGRPLRW